MIVPEILKVAATMVMLPLAVLHGVRESRFVSIKKKSPGGPAQVSGVFAPGVLLTRVIFRSNKTPEPESGVKLLENAEMRKVLIGPPPSKTLPETFQLLAVSPAGETGLTWKVTTVSSKVKSPWKPTRPSELLRVEVVTD